MTKFKTSAISVEPINSGSTVKTAVIANKGGKTMEYKKGGDVGCKECGGKMQMGGNLPKKKKKTRMAKYMKPAGTVRKAESTVTKATKNPDGSTTIKKVGKKKMPGYNKGGDLKPKVTGGGKMSYKKGKKMAYQTGGTVATKPKAAKPVTPAGPVSQVPDINSNPSLNAHGYATTSKNANRVAKMFQKGGRLYFKK